MLRRNAFTDRPRFCFLGLALAGLLTLPFSIRSASAQAPPAPGSQAPAVEGQPVRQSPPGQASKQRPLISFKEGSLTVQAKNASLRELVAGICAEARIAVQFAGELADQKISVEYANIPVDTALQQILKDFDAFYYYGVGDKPPAKLLIVWVYPKTKGRGLEPVPPEEWASTKELKEKFASKDAEARAKAIGALVQRLGDEAQAYVLDALHDPDVKVRAKALYQAQDAGLTLPQDILAGLAVSDQSSFVRVMALDGLSGNRAMQGLVEGALNDPDQYVQAKAKEILERWKWADQASRPQQPPQTQQQIQQQQADGSNRPQ